MPDPPARDLLTSAPEGRAGGCAISYDALAELAPFAATDLKQTCLPALAVMIRAGLAVPGMLVIWRPLEPIGPCVVACASRDNLAVPLLIEVASWSLLDAGDVNDLSVGQLRCDAVEMA